MKGWIKMTEVRSRDGHPAGYSYECAAGHQWFIEADQWENRGANPCPDCKEEPSGDSQSGD